MIQITGLDWRLGLVLGESQDPRALDRLVRHFGWSFRIQYPSQNFLLNWGTGVDDLGMFRTDSCSLEST